MSLRLCTLIAITIVLFTFGCSGDKSTGPTVPAEPAAHDPWEDEEAENLALLVSGYTWAPRDLYERIQADLLEIRQRWSDSMIFVHSPVDTARVIDNARHQPHFSPGHIWLDVDSATLESIANGEYHAWDSLNVYFGATTEIYYGHPKITSSQRINSLRMMEAYEELPGVLSAHSYSDKVISYREYNIYARQYPWGIGYVVDHGFGDCFSGCINHAYFYVRSFSDRLEYVGWTVNPLREGGPEWWTEASECFYLHFLGDERYLNRDTIPPAAISDLAVTESQVQTSARIAFTAPGEDGMSGVPVSYEVHWRYDPITEANWDVSSHHPELGGAISVPAQTPGSHVEVALNTLAGDTTNYIAVRTRDGRDNMSPISNVVSTRNELLRGWTCFNPGNTELPAGMVFDILCDTKGTIWVATSEGVGYFDGRFWHDITPPPGSLPSNNVKALAEDMEGNIWAGTTAGSAVFDGTSWTPVTPGISGGGSDEVRCVAVAPDGSIWMGYGYAGVVHYDDGAWENFNAGNSGLFARIVESIEISSDSSVWLGTNDGVFHFDHGGWTSFRPIPLSYRNYYSTLLIASDASIWCGSLTGYVVRRDEEDIRLQQLLTYGPSGFGSIAIDDIVETSNDDIWADGYTTLFRFANGDFADTAQFEVPIAGTQARDITALEVDREGHLWVGTRNSGVCRWDMTPGSDGSGLARR